MLRFDALLLACMLISEEQSTEIHIGCRVRVWFRMMGKRGRPLKAYEGTVLRIRKTSAKAYNRADIIFDDGEKTKGFRLFHEAHGKRCEAGWIILT